MKAHWEVINPVPWPSGLWEGRIRATTQEVESCGHFNHGTQGEARRCAVTLALRLNGEDAARCHATAHLRHGFSTCDRLAHDDLWHQDGVIRWQYT